MIAAHNPAAGVDGINVVHLSDGRRVHLDDIATGDEGQGYLDDLEDSIDRIEEQTASADLQPERHDPDWRRRAGAALKRKRRMRPRLQKRIADLRRAERQAAAGLPLGGRPELRDARRKAFINAAEQLLDADLFTEIWARAAEMEPAAFGEGAP